MDPVDSDARPVLPDPTELPNLRHLRLLVAAVETNSLTSAAHQLHISQPAASQAIAKLSRIFGVRLLERVGNNIAATSEGLVVLRRAARVLQHLRNVDLDHRPRRAAMARPEGADHLERYASMAQLRAIASFATTGSFALAARHLEQTESSVQRACRDLERIVAQDLFEGVQRNRLLTRAGQALAACASLALKEVLLAHAELRERVGVFDSRLVIGTLPLARTRLVPSGVLSVMARYPSARIEIIDGSYDALVQKLRFGTCDLIVGALRGAACGPGLSESVLLTDRLAVVARKGHPLAGRAVRPADMAQFPWILPRRDAPARGVYERLAQRHGWSAPSRGYVETGSLVALRGLLLGSDALTLISPDQIHYEYMTGLLAPLDFPVEEGDREIGITQLESALPSRLLRSFLESLEASAGEQQEQKG